MIVSHLKWVPSLMFLFLVVLIGGAESAHVLEGVNIPFEKSMSSTPWTDIDSNTTANHETQKIGSIRYYLNGAGVRSLSLLFNGWGDIKIYVASFYTTSGTPLTTEESIYGAIRNREHHLLFEFTFLRNVNQKRVADAWKLQLQHSVATEYSTYPEYERHLDTFIQSFGPIDNGGSITIQLLSNGNTLIFDQGYVYKGIINGHSFQYAFLSMWFGKKPVAIDLKSKLLGLHECAHYQVFRSVNITQKHSIAEQ
jgi:Chalcone isomerase-like